MHRKSLLSLFMLSMGVALIAAAMMVGTASAKSQVAGSLIVTQAGTGYDTLDPQLAYVSNDWTLLSNTELKLLNFPSKNGVAGTKLIPQGATAYPVISNAGKTYTFNLRSGLKLSDGSSVGCQNYVRSFERSLSPDMYAAYGVFNGFDKYLVGGKAFAEGNAAHISGITCPAGKIKFQLTQVVPFFQAVLGMAWYTAVKPTMAYNNTPGGIKVYPSGGPYYIHSNNLDTLTVLKRNPKWPTIPYFKSNWPQEPLTIVVKSNANSSGTPELLQAEKNQVDLAGVPSQDVVRIRNKYGPKNKPGGQYHVGPTTCVLWNAMNNKSANNATDSNANRKALNYAISRNVENAFLGPDAGVSTEQILVPAIPGYQKIDYYGGAGNLAAADAVPGQTLAGKHLNIYYRASSPSQTNIAEYIQSQVNGAPLNMIPHLVSSDPTGYYKPLMTKSIAQGAGGYNITASGGWCADYADAYNYFNVNFDGRTITDTGNTNYMYFNNATFNAHMDAAANSLGATRIAKYRALDKEFMQQYAPLIPKLITTNREFSSKRVHNWVYSNWQGAPFYNALKVF